MRLHIHARKFTFSKEQQKKNVSLNDLNHAGFNLHWKRSSKLRKFSVNFRILTTLKSVKWTWWHSRVTNGHLFLDLSPAWFQVASLSVSCLDPDNIICSTCSRHPRPPPTQPVAYLYPLDSSKEPSEAPQTSVCMTTRRRPDPWAAHSMLWWLEAGKLGLLQVETPEMRKKARVPGCWMTTCPFLFAAAAGGCAFGCSMCLALLCGLEVYPGQIKTQKYITSQGMLAVL